MNVHLLIKYLCKVLVYRGLPLTIPLFYNTQFFVFCYCLLYVGVCITESLCYYFFGGFYWLFLAVICLLSTLFKNNCIDLQQVSIFIVNNCK